MSIVHPKIDLADMLPTIEKLALSAGEVIMDIRERGVIAKSKSDLSPVTEADEQAEKIIIAGLSTRFPNIPIVAEEAAAAGVIPQDLGDVFFLVDPLDGTKEFISGREDFTVNIALIEKGAPVLGVVYAPAHRAMYCGAGASSAKCKIDNRGIISRTSLEATPYDGPTRVVASRSHMTIETQQFLDGLPGCQTINIGSSLKFCLVAEGQADIYPRFGRTMEWDTAAGDAVLRASGGSTVNLDGSVFLYGKQNQAADVDFANPHFIAKANTAKLS